MSIYVGNSEPKEIYVGTTPVKEVYVGTTKVRPVIRDVYIDFLLIGGGGSAANGSSYVYGGGGAGGVIQCCGYLLSKGSYPVQIGIGGVTPSGATRSFGRPGGDSEFNNLIAIGGGGGGGTGRCNNNSKGYFAQMGGSGGGGASSSAGGSYNGCGGCPAYGQGYGGGCGCSYGGGGGGGAGGPGCDAQNVNCCWAGMGGIGIQSDISGTSQWYAGGGSGAEKRCYCNVPANCGGTSGGRNGGTATICGAGAGGGWSTCSNCGGNGLFIIRYPTSCGYDVSGGTKYTCGDYTIHCFTSDGTLIVS